MQKIPATVITGFLGAGKTTMIRNLLTNAGGRKIALIINEFGDLGVDGDVLKGCGAEACTAPIVCVASWVKVVPVSQQSLNVSATLAYEALAGARLL